MIIYDFVIRGFICSLSPAPFFSYITFASARKRLLLCKRKFPTFFAESSKFYWLSKFSTD